MTYTLNDDDDDELKT